MGGSFSTGEEHAHLHLKPLRVASRKEEVFAEAKNLASDLPAWKIVRVEDERQMLVCERKGSPLSGVSEVTITCEGPDGIPSTTVHARSESRGGLPGFGRDRAHVLEFMKLFHRRVC